MGLFDFGQEGGLLGGFQQKLTSDPAAQRALLQFGLQMLAGRGRNTAENIGQAGLGAAQAYDQQSQMARQQQMQDWQIGQAKTEAQRKQAEWERQQRIQALPGQFAKPPMPPMNANDPNAQGKPGSFDDAGFIAAYKAIDPIGAAQYAAAIARQAPESPYSKIDLKDMTPESVQAFEAGGRKDYTVLRPVRKMEFVNGQAVNPYAVAPGTVLDTNDPNKPFALKGGQAVPNVPYQQYELANSKAKGVNLSVNTDSLGLKPKDRFEMEGKLADDYKGVTKLDNLVLSATSKIKTALSQKGALKDQAAIYSFAKMLDPEGAVREADYAAIANTTGLVDRVRGYLNRLATGEQLNDTQRAEMSTLMTAFEGVARKRIQAAQTDYSSQAQRYNLRPEAVFSGTIPKDSPGAPPNVDSLVDKYRSK